MLNQAAVTLPSEAATDRFGAVLANTLPPGSIVALCGTLGAGKTRLVRALAAALGIDPDSVTSPTFVLWHTYHGSRTIHHFDAYRLASAGEFWGLGADECFDGEALVLIEWAEKIQAALPAEHLLIELTATGETSRRADLSHPNETILKAIAAAWESA